MRCDSPQAGPPTRATSLHAGGNQVRRQIQAQSARERREACRATEYLISEPGHAANGPCNHVVNGLCNQYAVNGLVSRHNDVCWWQNSPCIVNC